MLVAGARRSDLEVHYEKDGYKSNATSFDEKLAYFAGCRSVLSTECRGLSRQNEKFLFGQSRKFRFDEVWRNAKRSFGCRQKIGIG